MVFGWSETLAAELCSALLSNAIKNRIEAIVLNTIYHLLDSIRLLVVDDFIGT